MKLKVKKLHPDVQLPKKATKGSACFDIYSYDTHNLQPGETYLFSTGLALEVPEGWMCDVRPRSGLSYRGVSLVNSPGTLDSDYRGGLMVTLRNNSPLDHPICKGDRIAQIRLVPVEPIEFEEVEELGKTVRGTEGLGSTGK